MSIQIKLARSMGAKGRGMGGRGEGGGVRAILVRRIGCQYGVLLDILRYCSIFHNLDAGPARLATRRFYT